MKLIRKTGLIRRHGNTVVHCEIELCEFAAAPDRYVVNVRQGTMGGEWRESTHTPRPVELAVAETIYQQTLAARMTQGFADPALAVAPEASSARNDLTSQPARSAITEGDRTLLRRLEPGSWKLLDQGRRNRTIWRIGERRLRTAVPVLVDQIQRGDAMQDYCIAWAIARCRDPGAAIAMRELQARGTTDAVRRMALLAWLMLATPEDRQRHAQSLVAAWPEILRAAFERGDKATLLTLATSELAWGEPALDIWLEQLDQVALCQPFARELLLDLLRSLPLRAGIFRAIRHLYKAAELRADAGMFALLHRRFETTAHRPATRVWIGGRYLSHADAAARPDSTVAYGKLTRHYLLRRGWRMLRRLGEQDDPSFVPLALGVLMPLDDSEACMPYQRAGRVLDRYAHWMLFNHLARAHAGLRHTPSGLTWYRRAGDPPADLAANSRQEAFPAIWDRHPEALLALMQESRCDGVHAFAARALADNQAFCAALSLDQLRRLLTSRYEPTARFAFAVARTRFEPGEPDADWLMLLARAALPAARAYAMDCIGRDPARYAGDPLLVQAILCAPDALVRRHGWILCQFAQRLPGKPEQIVLQLLDWLDFCTDIDDAANAAWAIAADLFQAIDTALREAAVRAPYERLLQLAAHPLAAVRVLACRWLMLHEVPSTALPGAVLTALLRDEEVAVRGMAVRLFGTLPDPILAQQLDLIAAFATSPDALVRGAIDSVIVRLASDAACRDVLLPALLDSLFRTETVEGLHDDILKWLTGPLDGPPLSSPDLLRRLLAARGKGAQRLGAILIGRFPAGQFDVADWAAFGRNQNAAVRRWAYAAFAGHPDMARANMEAALRLFDSKFDDTREFASGFFGTACSGSDWTPLLLVSLCDHPDPAAQRFGRAMITEHFDITDVAEFMLKLSQHPSANMQLFVSGWLESASGGDAGMLRRLEPYFLGVLSQVHRGRVVKGRVQRFLREQAMLSEEIAAFVAQVFARQVVTVAIGDKAQYIEALREIQQRYPALPAVMTIHQPPVRNTAGTGQESSQ
ncbi:hypothetical protein [Pseudoduganella umbonata]|uniref:HEAT repeat domain-containing protein n=1 Tax=Pseudoduganella umbonata TaxID=864828 RepID=A0A4P8HZE8_9BURK|nr:hypothetical protein [Pseudoduganella umbonata]MBB3225393.1 hypothetical protein [Pseudoduganella umbonata]QCP13934.1 hypothetical protein FCL38_28590 [Pseudoduganella umbonata]